ncbi:MAG: hypothetical protein EHM43_04230 [Ignavibacteriae bacterium]|nr:MAG: hypothetical protein EHM43_04230 [Ignavibacteriota bacterium]
MYLIRLAILALITSLICSGTAVAQWKITPDSGYGNAGISVDASALPRTSWGFEGVFVLDDGSAYTVRPSTSADTTVLVARMMKNGQPDPLFDLDGVMAMKFTSQAVDVLLSPQDLVWIGSNRAGRYELSEIDRLGRLRPTPLWQDTALYASNTPIDVQDDGTILMWSRRWNPVDSPLYLRFTKVGGIVPSSDVFVPFQTEPIDLSMSTMFVDRNHRLLAGTNVTQGSFAIARYTAAGLPDETFGNALGLLVLPVKDLGAQLMEVLPLRSGGYVMVLWASEINNNITETFLRLLRVDEYGDIVASFGTNGILDIRGSQMASRGIVECPNGDLLLASTGTSVYSHLYQIRADGTVIPGQYGAFDILMAGELLSIIDDRWLYGISYDDTTEKYAVSRFELQRVTSIDEENHTPLDLVIDGRIISVKGAGTTSTVSVYSLLGECVLRQTCAPGETVSLPASVSGALVVSASTELASTSKIVSVVR